MLVDGVVSDGVVEVVVVVVDDIEEDGSGTAPAVIRAGAGEVLIEEADPVMSEISVDSDN
jgi:hypothetical protein